MKVAPLKAIGGTGLRPVQLGVTPNCGSARTLCLEQTIISSFTPSADVSGVTPETTGETPVPPI
jgi:hypothetical protein